MKTHLISFTLLLTTFFLNAQLKGNGNTITKTYDFKNFDKLNFNGFNDDISIEIGNTFSIKIIMKEENEKKLLFNYNENEYELSLNVKPVTGKELYDERDTYQIKITMPEISVLTNTGNANINVTGIIGRYLRVINTGNGDVTCFGTIDELDIEKTGNGDINAKKLITKNAKIKSIGNGNVSVNVLHTLEAQNIGNGDVINYGKAPFNNKSKNKGNGSLQNL